MPSIRSVPNQKYLRLEDLSATQYEAQLRHLLAPLEEDWYVEMSCELTKAIHSPKGSELAAVNRHLAQAASGVVPQAWAAQRVQQDMGARYWREIAPLTKQQSSSPRETERLPVECLVHLVSAAQATLDAGGLKPEQEAYLQTLVDRLQKAFEAAEYLGSQPTIELRCIGYDCRKRGLSALKQLCDQLAGDVTADAPLTRRNDAIYQRAFESALVAQLIEQPPPVVIQAVQAAAKQISAHLSSLPEEIAQEAVRRFCEDMRHGPSGWLTLAPQGYQDILRTLDPKAAVARLDAFFASGIDSGWACVAAAHTIVVLARYTHVMYEDGTAFDGRPEWLERCDRFYLKMQRREVPAEWDCDFRGRCPGRTKATDSEEKRIGPPRSNDRIPGVEITLRYQPPINSLKGVLPSCRPVTKYTPALEHPWVRTTLAGGSPFVSGISGTTGMALHLYKSVHEQGIAIGLGGALAAHTMYVVADGGHSIGEVLNMAQVLDDRLGLGLQLPDGDAGALLSLLPESDVQSLRTNAWRLLRQYFAETSFYAAEPSTEKDGPAPSSLWNCFKRLMAR